MFTPPRTPPTDEYVCAIKSIVFFPIHLQLDRWIRQICAIRTNLYVYIFVIARQINLMHC